MGRTYRAVGSWQEIPATRRTNTTDASVDRSWRGGETSTPEMNVKTHVGQPPEPAGDGLLNKLDVAQWLDVSVGTVDNLRRRKKLRAIKVGSKVRFKRAEVERYLESEREDVDGAEAAVQDGGAKQGGKASRNVKLTGKEQRAASRDGAAEERKPTK